jgi:hypothetical protein
VVGSRVKIKNLPVDMVLRFLELPRLWCIWFKRLQLLIRICIASDCAAERGGLFNLKDSTSWKTEGFFSFGVDEQLGNTGYAEYGLDDLTFGTTGVSLRKAIIGSFNTTGSVETTRLTLGYFGVGIVPGNFNGTSIPSALSGLVEWDGSIPSHSYGYTAGAKYRESRRTGMLLDTDMI